VKICLVSNLYPPSVQGGAEVYVSRLAPALAKQDRVVVVTSEPGVHAAPRRESTAEGVTIYRLAPLNVGHLTRLPHLLLPQAAFRAIDFYHPQVAANFSTIVRRERPDVIHVHNWVGISLGALLSAADRTPVAMTVHDYGLCCLYADLFHPGGRGCPPGPACAAFAAVNRHLVKKVRLAISPSASALAVHEQRGFFESATRRAIPNGIPSLWSSPPAAERARRSSKSTFDVLYIGRVGSYKGPEVLIRAVRALSDLDLRLHVAGVGPALERCQELAAGDPRIKFYGFVEGQTRASLWQTADCMVLPALWPENFPVTIQEAFQFGPVVIASRVGGIPELVRDGVNGVLVERGDEAGLAAAITRLQRAPELTERLRSAAFETARLYDMRFHVARLTDAYRELLSAERVGDLDHRAA
jgi:glycosyltransferase involved in cell wall biosynthesis